MSVIGNDHDSAARWLKYLAAAFLCQGGIALLLRGAPQSPFHQAVALEMELVAAPGAPAPSTASRAAAGSPAAAQAAPASQTASMPPAPARPAEPQPSPPLPAPQASLQPKQEAGPATAHTPVSAASPPVAAVVSGGRAGSAGNTSPPSAAASPGGSGRSSGSTAGGGTLTQARPNYLHNPPPPYPPLARRRGLTGVVVLKVRVGTDGVAREVAVRGTSGHAVLDEAAVATVSKWRFMPARRGETSVESWAEVPIRFELNRREG